VMLTETRRMRLEQWLEFCEAEQTDAKLKRSKAEAAEDRQRNEHIFNRAVEQAEKREPAPPASQSPSLKLQGLSGISRRLQSPPGSSRKSRSRKSEAKKAKAAFPMEEAERGMTRQVFVEVLLGIENRANFVREPPPGYFDSPLNDYWISTSHNSYLVGNQLRSDTDPDILRRLLIQGARSLELDCWDDWMVIDRPIVTHGNTLCTKAPAEKMIKAIEQTAFRTSDLPVILSLEMHCSLKQQLKLANLFTTILKDKLVKASEIVGRADEVSPNYLRGRVLLKTKTRVLAEKRPQKRPHGADFVRDSEETRAPGKGSIAEKHGSGQHGMSILTAMRHDLQLHPSLWELISMRGVKKRPQFGEFDGEDGDGDFESQISPHNANFQFGRANTHNGSSPHLDPKSSIEIASISEIEIESYYSSPTSVADLTALRAHTKELHYRAYPSKFRVDSSNPNPLRLWHTGVQQMALNLQTNDLGTQLAYAFFELGGGKGYVLKPEEFRASPPRPWPPYRQNVKRVSIKLLSLHALPTVGEERPNRTDGGRAECHRYVSELSGDLTLPSARGVASPSISVELYTVGGFCCVSPTLNFPRAHSQQMMEATPTRGNGYTWEYGDTAHCLSAEPNMTIVRFCVKEGTKHAKDRSKEERRGTYGISIAAASPHRKKRTGSVRSVTKVGQSKKSKAARSERGSSAVAKDSRKVVAYEAAVLDLLHPGYRTLHLRSALGTRIECASLFVKIELDSEPHNWHTPTEQLLGLQLKVAEKDARISQLQLERETKQTNQRGTAVSASEVSASERTPGYPRGARLRATRVQIMPDDERSPASGSSPTFSIPTESAVQGALQAGTRPAPAAHLPPIMASGRVPACAAVSDGSPPADAAPAACPTQPASPSFLSTIMAKIAGSTGSGHGGGAARNSSCDSV